VLRYTGIINGPVLKLSLGSISLYSFLRILFLTTSTLTLIAACGGGGGAPDTTAPTVSPGTPSSAQVNAARNTTVTAVFSEPMNGATVDNATFTLKDNGGTPVTGGVTYSGVTATFTPAAQLSSSAIYSATITTGAEDTSGNGLVSDVSWSFTTASGDILISWDENLETAVNRNGGGYKVYYSTNTGFNPGEVGVTEIDVPYSSPDASAPTSVLVTLSPGTYYLRIAAYSALNPPGSSSGSMSTATPQMTLMAP